MTTTPHSRALSQGEIFRFFAPLSATWLMMAAEGPFVAAIIARLFDPLHNLAAYGVALAIGFVVEAPIIMMLSASTALVRDRSSYRRLRHFSLGMNLAVTAIIGIVLLPPVFGGLTGDLLSLPPRVAELAYQAVLALLPWPAAIGYRRFYHGILIASGKTRLVAYGTAIRLSTIAAAGLSFYTFGALEGAVAGTASLSCGVIAEAVAARLWARKDVARLLGTEPASGSPSYLEISAFYLPLALTPLITMAAQPMTTFFLGRGALPLESLAVMPVIGSFGFIFRCPALAFQEVVIALGSRGDEALDALRRFALGLGTAAAAAMAIVVLTPLSGLWFEHVSKLLPALLVLAIPAAIVLIPTPALSTAVSFLHARFVMRRATFAITAGTVIEVSVIAAVLAAGIFLSSIPGALVATSALLCGRTAAVAFLAVAHAAARKRAAALGSRISS